MNISNIQKALEKEPRFRIGQVYKAVFGELAGSWSEVTTFPKALREKLEAECPLAIEADAVVSNDKKTTKALVGLEDGSKIETVLMRHNDRNTVCVSCQVGCPMGCSFCATGKLGFTRNLTVDEIVIQLLYFSRILKGEGQKITNVVFMGMGEPFLNYDNVIGAIRFLNQKDALNLGMRRFSISTAGIVPGIDRLSKEGLEINLAVSLHAPNDTLRTKLMPVNKNYPVEALLEAVRRYVKTTRRKVMIEYAMIKGINDSEECAYQLSELLKGVLCVVNLIPYNETQSYSSSEPNTIERFKSILASCGLNVVQRFRYGADIDAACGQLAAKKR